MNDRTKKWWLAGLLLGLLFWWWLQRQRERPAPHHRTRSTAQADKPVTPPSPDDLKRIEGIGPKIASVLEDAGIETFEALASTEIERLQAILDASNIRLAWPDTWPEQAQLAATGDWSALQALQDELQGGRRM